SPNFQLAAALFTAFASAAPIFSPCDVMLALPSGGTPDVPLRNRYRPVPFRGRHSSFHWLQPPSALGFPWYGRDCVPASCPFSSRLRRRAAPPAFFLRE